MDAHFPVIRSASLQGYMELARSVGLNPLTILRRAGLMARTLEDPELMLGVRAVCEVLESSSEASGVEDFGLRLASRRKLSNLGPISLVLKEEASARQALDTFCRYMSLLNTALLVRVEEHRGLIVVREDVFLERSVPIRQGTELSVGILYRMLVELLGTAWKPVQVCFVHRPPGSTKRHAAFFGTRVMFNAEFNGLVCQASDLERRLMGTNPEMARFARQYLDRSLPRGPQSTQANVRQLIAAMLSSGRCTSQRVAQHLGVDRRTIHRQLASEGQTFSQLLQSVRSELALHQVRDSDLPLSDVAALLGFSSQSAFSHWFTTSFGTSAIRTRKMAAMPLRPNLST
jgi:AraC-like DNA-binding protein